jgi:hypothetical protein
VRADHRLVSHANAVTPEKFGDLSPQSGLKEMASTVPVMATPLAVAAGVTITAAAGVAGFAAEEAGDG